MGAVIPRRGLSKYTTQVMYNFLHRGREIILRLLNKPLFIILLWSLWVSAEYWILFQHSYMRVHDNAESIFAFYAITSQLFADYGFSVWVPNITGGIDGLVNVSSDYFTYDFPFFFLLPDWLAYSLIMFLQRFVATYFTYRLCRDFLHFGTGTAILAGLFWSLGTWTTNDWTLFDGLGVPAIPFYLYLLELSLNQSGRRRYIWASVTGLLVSYFSFFPLFTPFFFVGSFVWLWLIRGYGVKSIAAVYIFFGVFSFFFDIPQLFAIYLNARLSGRVERSLISIPIDQAMDTAIYGFRKYFWTYRVLWTFTFIGLLFTQFKDKLLVRLTLLAIVIVLFTKILWVISVTSRETLGFVSILNFNGFILIATFMPSVAAAYAVESGSAGLHLLLVKGWQSIERIPYKLWSAPD